MVESKIVRLLKKARKNRGYTQEEVAELTGMSARNLSRIETCVVPLTMKVFLDLCKVYNVQPDEIINTAKKL